MSMSEHDEVLAIPQGRTARAYGGRFDQIN